MNNNMNDPKLLISYTAYYNAGDYTNAMKELILAQEAEKKDGKVTNELQNLVGEIAVRSTELYTPNFVEWIQKQVVDGNSCACDHYGDMFYFGRGVERDYEKAAKQFEMGVALGNAHAMYNLGYITTYGHGVGEDISKATKLLIKSCCLGCSAGKVILRNIISNELHDTGGINDIVGKLCDSHLIIGQLDEDNEILHAKNAKLEERIKKLEEENEMLKTEIMFMPGGQGYEMAKKDAENLFEVISMKQVE